MREDIWVGQKARAKYFLLMNQRIANFRGLLPTVDAAVKLRFDRRADSG